ncbi:PREDICTED: fas-binding factor 1 homolog, partial [Merops nubicus]|uniref:fas-binding factor 1 homolog n=1 Tax=Merops nubicus TaxID=57421 RepID=UPI0004F003F7
SFDDEFEDLLGSSDKVSVQSARASQLAGDSSGRARGSSSRTFSPRSFLEDDFFSKLPAEDVAAAGGSSAPGADPPVLLQSLKDMDEMDAELLGLSKPSSGPGMMTVKGPGKCDSLGGGVRTAPEKGEPVPVMKKKPLSSPAASQKHKKLSFADLDDPLAGLLSDEEQDAPKKPPPAGTRSSPEEKPKWSKEKDPKPPQTPLHVAASARRRPELTFEDDGEDLLDALGLGRCPEGNEKQEQKAEEEKLRPDHSKLDELLGRGSVAKVLEEPGTGEHEEFQLDKKDPKQPEKEEDWNKEDFVFGAYQPTVATMPRGQAWRRQPVSRFSAEGGELKAEPSSRAPPAARQSPLRSSGAGADWLGLKEEDLLPSELPVAKATPKAEPREEEEEEEEEDWLSAALARKRALAQAKAQERAAKPSEAPGKGLDPPSPASLPAASTAAPQQAAALQDKAASTSGSRQPVPWLSTTEGASAPPWEPTKGDPSRDTGALASLPGEQEMQGPAQLAQVATAPVSLQPAPQLQWQAALLSTQARVAELQSQVQTLELERTQHKLLLESLQQRHQEDLNLLESSYRSQLKVLEETCRQREERLRREREQVSVEEMRKEHEEQLQWLKRLKEEEVEAVTSAVSHTRSLNGVMEQMEKFSRDLQELSRRMEATQHSTSQELATEARQQGEQLRASRGCAEGDELNTWSFSMRKAEEERGRLQETVAKLEARLREQSGLLEQERWRVAVEQSRVESLQHSLEEQRRVVAQQLATQRGELERAK